MSIDLLELESFLLLCQTCHFGQAAEQLHISQPALSKQLQRLEKRVGGKLVDRDTRSFALTSAGEVLREAGQDLLNQARRAEYRVSLALEGKAGRLNIGFGIACLSAGLGDLLREYREQFPEVEVTLQDMPSPAQLQALEEQRLDIGFVRAPVTHSNLESTPIFQERLVVAYPAAYGAESGTGGLSRWALHPFVALQPAVSSSFHQHFLGTCRAAGFTPRVVQYTSELLTALHLVAAGIGVALVPQTASRMNVPDVSFAETGLTEAAWQIGITRHRDRREPLLDHFVALALDFAARGSAHS